MTYRNYQRKTLCDVIDKKGVFISEGMDRIQSLISGEKRLQRPFSVFTKLNSKKVITYFLKVLENKYCISCNKRPWRSFNFEALKCDTYFRVALKKGRRLFQSNRNYSHGVLKLCNVFFSKLRYLSSLVYFRTTIFFSKFSLLCACSMCILVQLRLNCAQISTKRRVSRYSAHQRAVLISDPAFIRGNNLHINQKSILLSI